MHDRSFAFVLLTMAASLSSRWLLVPLLVLGTLATVLAWWESNETSTDALKTETSASSEFSWFLLLFSVLVTQRENLLLCFFELHYPHPPAHFFIE